MKEEGDCESTFSESLKDIVSISQGKKDMNKPVDRLKMKYDEAVKTDRTLKFAFSNKWKKRAEDDMVKVLSAQSGFCQPVETLTKAQLTPSKQCFDENCCKSDDEMDEEGNEADSDESTESEGLLYPPPSLKKSESPKICSCFDKKCDGKNRRSGDAAMKDFSMEFPLSKLGELKCNQRFCIYGGDCISTSTIGSVYQLRREFWGDIEDAPPSSKVRASKLREIFKKAYCHNKNEFCFQINSDNCTPKLVCEGAFIILLGLSNSPNVSEAPRQWSKFKDVIVSELSGNPISSLVKSSSRIGRACPKFDDAVAYITFISLIMGDTSPYAGKEKLLILPYESVISFHEEYIADRKSNGSNTSISNIAELSTFRKAFNSLTDIRLTGCKGSFQTCEICNNANKLLRDTAKRFTKHQREIILKYKALHLQQQAKEREYLDLNKERCRKDLDEFGQPKCGLLFSDGMTIQRCNTPKVGQARFSKGDKFVETRVIGVEAICGPVDTIFIYYTDDLVSGGSDIMVEIQRQALIDLAAVLKEDHSLELPRNFVFQFDNCGENKNKEMFGYMSLLIESFEFDTIEVNFLIVGHTHSSIDQFFSSLSKAIGGTDFIGSPLALIHLFKDSRKPFGDFENDRKEIRVARQIIVYYDFRSAISPYINKNIHFYQLPHCFKFTRIFNCIAVMQYKLFSSNPQYLPLPPSVSYGN